MKKTLLTLALAASALLGAHTAMAQTAAPGDQLYKAFGEKPGLVVLMDDFMTRLLADPRTGPHFKPANQQRIKEQLVDQFCALAGGPCVYKGADMQSSHANLDIKKSDFHALVEVLQQSMDAQGIAFRRQNEMLALLAPMHRDIITPKEVAGQP
ncbi:MAG: group 1 truncated hemoglobin [Polaromonas sp. 39-63-203]|jgi:hemoglobin|uniref:group I truncated hemoglobin n=1 Tax=Polaromonas sp. TaxID=1869339 RepID=UPI000BD96416|nr:group 1 truncated hemoglobin [Polaromonas sp.]OYY52201.1 MAG: group 1 truncated hemoglobin [Polaromonas sp. 35-63-240]OYY96505.1 MAG: group 1 truncated hemoglobin [Polaromonas sp. 28-63-22]OYZ83633.1 MAG: group 1 truncated hemoglobin [Polaromonas sp. 24-62-144]OZA97524.1 MAG: group 1 truncated hemoglobin [Polaromonas sp. 39-63-203]HQS30439.1 group 1 truncated hemoglobin [Polaromonas sp.]